MGDPQVHNAHRRGAREGRRAALAELAERLERRVAFLDQEIRAGGDWEYLSARREEAALILQEVARG